MVPPLQQTFFARDTITVAKELVGCVLKVVGDDGGEVSGRIVEVVDVGYAGGAVADPSYEDVCSGATGHAEVVQITFDPDQLSFGAILDVFFGIHDPTTLNRQGADVGSQYRSAIFYHNEEQRKAAEDVIRQIDSDGAWDSPIVTEVTPFSKFYLAEAYHQGYFRNNPNQGYCQAVINPKVVKFQTHNAHRLKSS